MKTILIYYLASIVIFTSGYSQNIIQNSSFENNGQPDGQGWFDQCGEIIYTVPDTICSAGFYPDAPPGNNSNWSLNVFGQGNSPAGYAETYITSQNDTSIYELKIWMKKLGGNGSAYASLKIKSQSQISFIEADTTIWKLYTIIDTLILKPTDTMIVSLYASAPGPNSVNLLCDSVELKKNNIHQSESAGITKKKIYNNIKIYPNPATNEFKIIYNFPQKTYIEIQLINMNGQLLFKQELKTKDNSYIKKIGQNDYSKGLYILRLITNNGVYNKKLIIE